MILLLLGCLPPDALSRQAEYPSSRYQLTCTLHTDTDGAKIPAFEWDLSATLDLGYTRTFRDHSIGTLVQFTEATARVDGQEVASGLKGLRVELRAFDRGEVLALPGADAGVGLGKHLEALDVLWPALVPRIDADHGQVHLLTSWPVADDWHLGRTHLEGEGTVERQKQEATLQWTGTLTQSDTFVHRDGTVTARTVVDDANDRVLKASWQTRRRVQPQWRAGPEQEQQLDLELQYLGPAAPLPITPPPQEDSRYADALPLVLSDGGALQHPEVHAEDALPFLVFPDTWSPAEIAVALGE